MISSQVPRVLGAVVLAACALAVGAVAPAAAAPRLVALTPFTANTASDLGARPVAIGETLGGRDRFSRSLRGVPRLRLTHPSGPNLEQLARFNPRTVLSAPVWRRGHRAMARLGMRVHESEPRSVGQVPEQTRRLGGILGRRRAADARARRIERRIARATAGIRRRPRVLVILGVGRTSYAMLANSWGGDVVRRAGGRLLTQGLRAGNGYARISDETVVARNPEVIIAVPHGNARDIGRLARYLREKPGWRTTRAARRGRVYVATGNSLLQPYADVDRTIRDVRRKYLRNG